MERGRCCGDGCGRGEGKGGRTIGTTGAGGGGGGGRRGFCLHPLLDRLGSNRRRRQRNRRPASLPSSFSFLPGFPLPSLHSKKKRPFRSVSSIALSSLLSPPSLFSFSPQVDRAGASFPLLPLWPAGGVPREGSCED